MLDYRVQNGRHGGDSPIDAHAPSKTTTQAKGDWDLILLYIYMGISGLALGLAGLMEYQGLKQEVSGANGFIWTMILILMFGGLLLTALIDWIFVGFGTAVKVLLFGAGWLAAAGFASLCLMMLGSKR